MKCAFCDEKECREGKNCICLSEDTVYEGSDLESMKVSASIEARYYMQKTRLEELILYARDMGYKKLGLAFCVGLDNEARTIQKILERDFEVFSVCCKVSGTDKGEYGLERLRPENFDPTCNPIIQADTLKNKETQLNIIIGLCIGHDILFTQHSAASVTTFVVKDRVLAHNPAGARYSGYYLKKRFGLED